MLSSDENQTKQSNSETVRHFGIVGGGLAGLSVAYHLLEKSSIPIQITILDRSHAPGIMGASAVAGGLLHPFSPRGKLLHLGLEGLESTNRLIHASLATSSKQNESENIILRDCLFRIAMSDKNVKELQQTNELYPDIATWMSSTDVVDAIHGYESENQPILGGVKLEGGCKVIYVPSYLKGLWKACQLLAEEKRQTEEKPLTEVQWKQQCISADVTSEEGKQKENIEKQLDDYDTIILAAGSGLWHDFILDRSSFSMELVRGQSIKLTIPQHENENAFSSSEINRPMEAILCGKYMTPIPSSSSFSTDSSTNKQSGNIPYSMVVGATHEYKEVPLSKTEVMEELKKRSYNLHPRLWDKGKLDNIKSGWRVQSARSRYGRIPMVGRLLMDNINSNINDSEEEVWTHQDVWLMTGLSSRGLIYHGIYGDILADAILMENGENIMLEKYPHLDWWKQS